MSNEALKLELIQWLSLLEDESTMQYLKVVKDSTSSKVDWWDQLSENQKNAIKLGIEDIENGRVVSHQEVMKRFGI